MPEEREIRQKKTEEERQPEHVGGLNGFMLFLNKAATLFYLDICWLLACIPVITIGPATVALYSAIHKSIICDEGYALKVFWAELKGNFKAGVKVWLPLLAAMALVGWEISYLYRQALAGEQGRGAYLALLIPMALLVLTFLYAVAYLSKFTDTTYRCIRNSLVIMLMHPLRDLLALLLLVMLILFAAFLPWTLLILPATFLMMFVNFADKMFADMMQETQPDSGGEETP